MIGWELKDSRGQEVSERERCFNVESFKVQAALRLPK